MSEIKKESISRSKKYLIYLFVILFIVQILDSYVSLYNNVVPSKVIEQFLPGFEKNVAESIMTFCLFIASFGAFLAFFTHNITDKIGRKIPLLLNVVLMGIISLLIFFSVSIVDYTIYLLVLYILNYSDFWLMYVNEESPAEKKAFWTNMVLLGGVLGALLMPLFRAIFITETSPVGSWKGMTYLPIFMGIPLGIIIALTIKETSKYELIKNQKIEVNEKSSNFREGLKTILKSDNKSAYLTIVVIYFIRGINQIFITLGEVIISSSPYLSEGEVALVILAMGISSIFGYLFTGILADKIGRKPLLYIYCALFPIGMIFTFTGVNNPQYAFAMVTTGAVLSNLGYWGVWITISIIVIELVPTEVRGTGSGFKVLMGALGVTIGTLLSSFIAFFVGLEVALFGFSFLYLIGLPLNFLYLKETKGTDLSEVDKT